METLSAPKLSKLEGMVKVLNHFRTLDSEFPPQIAVIFLEVALSPGLTLSAIADKVGLSLPAVSRNIERLGTRWGMNRQGEGLVVAEENPANRRERLVRLSPKGERFLNTLVNLMD